MGGQGRVENDVGREKSRGTSTMSDGREVVGRERWMVDEGRAEVECCGGRNGSGHCHDCGDGQAMVVAGVLTMVMMIEMIMAILIAMMLLRFENNGRDDGHDGGLGHCHDVGQDDGAFLVVAMLVTMIVVAIVIVMIMITVIMVIIIIMIIMIIIMVVTFIHRLRPTN